MICDSLWQGESKIIKNSVTYFIGQYVNVNNFLVAKISHIIVVVVQFNEYFFHSKDAIYASSKSASRKIKKVSKKLVLI